MKIIQTLLFLIVASLASAQKTRVAVADDVHIRQTADRAGRDQRRTAAGSLADKVTGLPGQPTADFDQYSGYINVAGDRAEKRFIFFWFVQATQAAREADRVRGSETPLTWWSNGGPGCSGLIGLMTEHGPWRPTVNGTGLEVNTYSFNQVSHMLYVEQPSGVGFSYSQNTTDYNVGDQQAADDSYTLILEFLQMFPEYAQAPFWVTSESYGGHYAPELTLRIIQGNAEGSNAQINLQGMQVGNAWTDAVADNIGAVTDWYQHAMISNETFNAILSTCDFANIGPEMEARVNPAECNKHLATASTSMAGVNIYMITADLCAGAPPLNAAAYDRSLPPRNQGEALFRALGDRFSGIAQIAGGVSGLSQGPEGAVDPCINSWVKTYLNRADVQTALHASPTAWSSCSSVVNYSRKDLLTSMLPVYKQIAQQGPNVRLLVFSGDLDAIVPTPGTRAWLEQLDMQVTQPWRPWNAMGSNGQMQTGGWVTVYDALTFSTIRGAGHTCPSYEPARSLHLFTKFMRNEPL